MAAPPPSSSSAVPSDNVLTDPNDIETAKWTRYLPQAFGIRATVQASKYRWCVREAAMWGIATGTAQALHRLRMHPVGVTRAVNVGFLSLYGVYAGSYYFCVKRRDHREKMIELMMKLNSFEHAISMPPTVPVDEQHPFAAPTSDDDSSSSNNNIPNQQYVANLPERKEWQSPLPSQDAATVFQPVVPASSSDKKSR